MKICTGIGFLCLACRPGHSRIGRCHSDTLRYIPMLALHHPSSIFSLERLPPLFVRVFPKIRIESRWIAVSSPSVFDANYAFSVNK